MHRTSILNALARRFAYSDYLEIGLGDGSNFNAVVCASKTGVDPDPAVCAPGCVVHRMTSDAFFAGNRDRFDLIFIDGLHHAQTVERDLRHALACLSSGGTIVCHDLNPHSEAMQRVPRGQIEWTGDCWRAWLRLREERPDLRMFVVEGDYGVGVILPDGPPPADPLNLGRAIAGISYEEFARRKAEWLPLVTGDWFRAAIGEQACPRGGNVTLELPETCESHRPFLVYCPTDGGDHLFGADEGTRLFDVALNDYSGTRRDLRGADWCFAESGHKWPCIVRNLPRIERGYEAYAILDNDIEISTDELNTLFLTGHALGLDLFQAALSSDSHTNYPGLKARAGSYVRPSGFVEIMMPVFSRRALELCWHTFGDSESGWGLDVVWPKYLAGHRIAIVDAVVARHGRPVESGSWKLSNGLTPQQELEAVASRHSVAR